MAPSPFLVVIKGPCLFWKAQYQNYVVFSYLLHNNSVLMS